MAGITRVVLFSEGVSTTAPLTTFLSTTSFASYANDAAFVTAKGSAAADGDSYYNTTTDFVKVYANGSWVSLVDDTNTQTLTNKTLGNTNTITLKDTLFTLQDDGDATKQARFQASGISAGQTRIMTIPDSDFTIVGLALTQSLTNKTFDNTTTFETKDTLFTLQDDGDNTKKMQFQLSGITAGQTRILTVPDANITIVGAAATQTLTNKTFDDAITLKQIATPSNPAANYNKLYVKSDDKPYVLTSAGVEKGIGGLSAWLTATPYLANDIVFHTDDEIYRCTTNHTSGTFTTDQTSGYWERLSEVEYRNLILNPYGEIGVSDYVTYADAAATTPVDMTGGSPNITVTRNTTTPLKGYSDILLTKGAANRQGEGFAYTVTMPKHLYGKTVEFSFDYAIASGTYADSDLYIYVYDVTNSTLIQPVNVGIASVTTGLPNKHIGFFQTSTTGTSYRVGVHVSSTSASAYTVQFSNFYVGEQKTSYGPIVTDWVSFTPTGSWVSNTTYTGRKRRIGDSAEYEYYLALTGAPTAANLTLNLPSGEVIDTSKLGGTGIYAGLPFSIGGGLVAGGAEYIFRADYLNTTSVSVMHVKYTSGTIVNLVNTSSTTPATFANGDYIRVNFKVPIVGWSSNVAISSEGGDGRVVALDANAATGTITSSLSDLSWTTIRETTGSFSGTTWTCPYTGWYDITAYSNINATYTDGQSALIAIIKNGTEIARGDLRGGVAGSVRMPTVHKKAYLTKGDAIKIQASSGGTSPTLNATATHHHFGISSINAGTQRVALTEAYLKKSESPNPNLVYNGNMDHWLVPTAQASAASGTRGAEGFSISYGFGGVIDINRSTSVPTPSLSNQAFPYSFEVDVTTADASVAAGDLVRIIHRIEGDIFSQIHMKQATLSFWAYATKNGISCVSFRNSASDRSYIAEYTITASNTWEFEYITLNLDTSGTWSLTQGTIGIAIEWALMAGTDWQNSANTWLSANDFATSNQVNHMDSTSNFYRLTGVKFERGSEATPFTLMTGGSATEKLQCLRYYEKSYADTTAVGTSSIDHYIWHLGYNVTSAAHTYTYPLVPKAVSPTMTFYDFVGNSGKVSIYDNTFTKVDNTTLTSSEGRSNKLIIRYDGAISGFIFHFEANARL